ncbi:MAG: hypothetical protein ACRDBG_21890, partial [Waterburya sp.]
MQDEAEANKQILASELETNKARLAATESLIAKLGIISQSLSKSKDSKEVAEREKIEEKITQLTSQAAKQRTDISKAQAEERRAIEEKLLKDLDAANVKALAAIDVSEKLRSEAVKRSSIGNVEAKKNEATQLALIERDSINKRLALAQLEVEQLNAIKASISPEEFAQRQLAAETKKSQAIIALSQNETALLAAEQDARVLKIEESFDLIKEKIESQKISLGFDAEELAAQQSLLESQLELVEAVSSAKLDSFNRELENIDKAAELQKELSETEITNVNTRAELQKQLNELGLSGIQKESDAAKLRQAVQVKIFAEERAALALRQDIELKIFEVKSSQQKIAAQIAVAEKQLQVIESQRLVQTLIAQKAEASRIAAAREAVAISERGVSLAKQTSEQLDKALENEKAILGIKQQKEVADLKAVQVEKEKATALEISRAKDREAVFGVQQAAKAAEQASANTAKSAESVAQSYGSAANSAKNMADTLLGDARVGAVRLVDEAGKLIGIFGQVRTVDPTDLLREELNL